MLNNTPSKNQLVSGLTPRNTSKFLIHQTFNTDDSERTADNDIDSKCRKCGVQRGHQINQ